MVQHPDLLPAGTFDEAGKTPAAPQHGQGRRDRPQQAHAQLTGPGLQQTGQRPQRRGTAGIFRREGDAQQRQTHERRITVLSPPGQLGGIKTFIITALDILPAVVIGIAGLDQYPPGFVATSCPACGLDQQLKDRSAAL